MDHSVTNIHIIIGLLKEQDAGIVSLAIEKLLGSVTSTWFLVIEHLQLLQQIYQQNKGNTNTPLLISKILFYADRIEEAVDWALESQFDLTERSLYSDTMLSIIVQQYREILKLNASQKNILNEGLMFKKQKLEKIVEFLIQKSIQLTSMTDTMQLIGITVELQKWEYLHTLLTNLDEQDFCYFISNTETITCTNNQRVKELCLRVLEEKNYQNLSTIFTCSLVCGNSQKIQEVILHTAENNPALCCQFLSEISAKGNEETKSQLAQLLAPSFVKIL